MRLSPHWLVAAAGRGRPFFVTTPIFYVNAAPHLGHAYSAVVADAAARLTRLTHPGSLVLLSSGTDEHGSKIQRAAAAACLPVHQYCDHISAQYQAALGELRVQCTDFVRTTQPRHKKAVQHFWNVLRQRDYLYKTRYSGWYCVSDEAFVPESQLREEVRDGQQVKVSTESGHPVEWTDEDNYMFRLSAFRQHLLDWLSKEGVITPSKYQQQLVDLLSSDQYLPDISVSRPRSRVHWAVPVPDDEEQSVYVWLDALVNYLTVTGYPDADSMRALGRLWPADLHVVGKDILKFHAIYWPAFLMAAGLHPPRRILCHGHWTVDARKMSKSLGNVVDPRTSRVGHEALRYFLLREATMHSDANYSEVKLVRTVNSELADSLGNLVARCTRPALNPRSEWCALCPHHLVILRQSEHTQTLLSHVERLPDRCLTYYRDYRYYKVVDSVMATLHAANLFFESERPWQLRRPELQRQLDTVLHLTMETLRVCAVVLHPIVPDMTAALLDKLQVPVEERTWRHIEQPSWSTESTFVARSLSPDNVVIFQRILDKPADNSHKQADNSHKQADKKTKKKESKKNTSPS